MNPELRQKREQRGNDSTALPIVLNTQNPRALVVGGGVVGARKIQGLLKANWSVVLISKDLHESISPDPNLQIHQQPFEHDLVELKSFTLIFCCTDDSELNASIRKAAQSLGILVNCADDPENSDFQTPALIRDGDLSIALSTSGKNPGQLKHAKSELQELLKQHPLKTKFDA